MQLKVHEPTVQLMKEHYAKTGKEVNKARLRMATLPEGAEVNIANHLKQALYTASDPLSACTKACCTDVCSSLLEVDLVIAVAVCLALQ